MAYASARKRAEAIVYDWGGRGIIEEGRYTVPQACICDEGGTVYRATNAPYDMTGHHLQKKPWFCCPHHGHNCGEEHPVGYYPWKYQEVRKEYPDLFKK